MKAFLLSICVFFAVLATAYSLKCYHCGDTSDKNSGTTCSKDNLEKNKDKYTVSCSGQCTRLWVKKDDVTYIENRCYDHDRRDCKAELEASCDNIYKPQDAECAVSCCDTDLCNAGSPVSFSVILMTVCAALGLALLK